MGKITKAKKVTMSMTKNLIIINMGQIICIIEMGADEKAQVGAVWMTCHSIKMSTIKFRTMEIYYACISRGEEVQVFLCTIVWAWSSSHSQYQLIMDINFQVN